jgi:hypothetical protein
MSASSYTVAMPTTTETLSQGIRNVLGLTKPSANHLVKNRLEAATTSLPVKANLGIHVRRRGNPFVSVNMYRITKLFGSPR